jgi:hypothetical protein
MGELEAALQKHLGQITQAQLIPQAPENHEQNDISGIFQVVEGSPCTFVEGALAS